MDMAAINSVDSLVWGPIMLTLLVGTGEFQQDRGFFYWQT